MWKVSYPGASIYSDRSLLVYNTNVTQAVLQRTYENNEVKKMRSEKFE